MSAAAQAMNRITVTNDGLQPAKFTCCALQGAACVTLVVMFLGASAAAAWQGGGRRRGRRERCGGAAAGWLMRETALHKYGGGGLRGRGGADNWSGAGLEAAAGNVDEAGLAAVDAMARATAQHSRSLRLGGAAAAWLMAKLAKV